MSAVPAAAEQEWTDRLPTRPGVYWYGAPASYEPPVRVRIERVAAGLQAWFPDLPIPVPMRMLAGARWAGPLSVERRYAPVHREAG